MEDEVMAHLFFKYAAMNSGISIEILKVAYNYKEQNKPVLLMTSGLDTRAGRGKIASRIGLEEKASAIFADTKDRKSTRLNSSHVSISYAVFCLKKKNEAYADLWMLDINPELTVTHE